MQQHKTNVINEEWNETQNDAPFVAFYDMGAVTFVLPDEMADAIRILGLEIFPKHRILDWPKLKASADKTNSRLAKIEGICRQQITFDSKFAIWFWKGIKNCLTHYQTTNFRLFQTERVCRRQFQI